MASEKHTITIRLTPNALSRLDSLCDHLGTNRNSYLVNAIGKAISRDEMSFMVQQNSSDMFSKLSQMMSDITEEKGSE